MSTFFDRFMDSGYICAHRGARSIAPENTWMAMVTARKCGSDLWETDVQLTADGELVLIHDTTLTRTTNVSDHPEFTERSFNVTDFTAEELASLDAGSWFLTADPFKTIERGMIAEESFPEIATQKIPRLHDVLDYCRDNDFPLNIEIKDQSGTPADDQIVAKVLQCLKESHAEDLVLISSFNHHYLRQAKQLNPAISLAALVEDRHPDNLLTYLSELGVDTYHPDHEITPPDHVRELVTAGIRVNLWTVNDVRQAEEYIAAGATFICTDWPQQMVHS